MPLVSHVREPMRFVITFVCAMNLASYRERILRITPSNVVISSGRYAPRM